MGHLKIDEEFVITWSDRYLANQRGEEAKLEYDLFSRVSAASRQRASLTSEELAAIGRWKSPRARSRLAMNDEVQVQTVTSIAFAPDMTERASTLMSLHGVGEPMASAILAVWNPDDYTVFDWRATDTLRAARLLPTVNERVTFGLYLASCRDLAASLSLPGALPSKLRLLDRALWEYSQQKGKWQ